MNNVFGNKLPPMYLVTDDDIKYFEDKLTHAIEQNTPEEELLYYKRQLDLLKDTVVIYHEHRLQENKNGS